MKVKGITLIELVIVLALMLVITAAAFPSMANIIDSAKASSVRQTWIQFLRLGRSSAVTLQSVITACPMVGDTCTPNLNDEWVMFTDDNKNKQIDSTDQIIRTLQPSDQIRFKIYPGSSAFFRFYNQPTGIYSGLLRGFTICPTGKADRNATHLTINIMGRVTTSKERNSDGVPLRKVGSVWKDITC